MVDYIPFDYKGETYILELEKSGINPHSVIGKIVAQRRNIPLENLPLYDQIHGIEIYATLNMEMTLIKVQGINQDLEKLIIDEYCTHSP